MAATHEYILYLIIQVLGGLAYNVWVSRKVDKDYPYLKEKKAEPLLPDEKKSLIKNVKALAINKLSGVLVNSTDNIAITYFTGLGSTGITSNYTLVSSTVGSLIGLVFNALPGSVGNLNATTDDEGRYRFFKVLNFLNFWLFGWGSIGIAFVSSDLVAFLFGEKYVLPFYIPLIIAINWYTIGMLQASYTYKSTLGLFRYGQYLLFFTGFINIVLDVILGRAWGVFGILFATFIARACTNLWYEPYAVFRYGLKKNLLLYWKEYCKYGGILLLIAGICSFMCGLCRFSIVWNVIVKFAICSIVPNAIIILIFRKTEEFQYLYDKMQLVIRKVRRRSA